MLCSVIVYTYDRREFILNAIRSVAEQTIDRSDYEIIVVKGFQDAEIDGEINKLADSNIYVNEKAHGKKLVPAIRAAKGDIVFFLDDDDDFRPSKLETVLARFNNDKNVIFVHDSPNKMNDQGQSMPKNNERAPKRELSLYTDNFSRSETSGFLKYRANWYSSCMAFRRDVLLKNIESLEKVDQSVDPFLFFMAICASGKLLFLPQRLTRYRVHESTTNYVLDMEEFISRRLLFYTNTLRIYELAQGIAHKPAAKGMVSASISSMQLIITLLNRESKRRDIFVAVISMARCLKIIVTRYVLVWLFFGFLRFLLGTTFLKPYYAYSRSQVSPTNQMK